MVRYVRRRPFRARRQFRRRVTRRVRSARSATYNARSGSGRSIGMRSRRIRPRAYRNILWRTTQLQAHWRSLTAFNNQLTSPATNTTVNTYLYNSIADDFWTAAGGLLTQDVGVTAPTGFAGEITIRGGLIGITFVNNDDVPVNVNVWLCKMNKQLYTYTTPTAAAIGWDPTCIADFHSEFGKIVWRSRKQILSGDTFTCEYKLPVMRIDQEQHNRQQTFMWFVSVGQLSGTVGTNLLNMCRYHNLSFAADAYAPAA